MKKLFSLMLFLLFMSVQSQEWITDMQKAGEIAARENKKIILVFSGSDWCAPCIKLEKEIWNSPEFQEYAKEHYVMLRADFPRKKKNQLPKEQQEKNNKLFEKYNPQGYFPFVVVLTPGGKVLGTTGYKKVSPGEYIKELNSFENE